MKQKEKEKLGLNESLSPFSRFLYPTSLSHLSLSFSLSDQRNPKAKNLIYFRPYLSLIFLFQLQNFDSYPPCLNLVHNESIFDLRFHYFYPRDYCKSSSGFEKTTPYQATFPIESFTDIRKNLYA